MVSSGHNKKATFCHQADFNRAHCANALLTGNITMVCEA